MYLFNKGKTDKVKFISLLNKANNEKACLLKKGGKPFLV